MARTTATRREMMILGGLALGTGTLAAGALASGTLASAATADSPANGPLNQVDPHQHIRAAIHELDQAAEELRTAAHDFGGHRKEALHAVEVAHRQLKICLEHEKR